MTASARRGTVPVRAERHQSARLLKARVVGLIAVVEDSKEAIAHIARQQVQLPHGKERRRAAANAQRQPALCHARGKDHADEDEEIHQRAARVTGDDDDQPHHKGGMRRRLNDVFKAHKVSPILQQRKLIGEQNDEKDLHDLCRLHRDGEMA